MRVGEELLVRNLHMGREVNLSGECEVVGGFMKKLSVIFCMFAMFYIVEYRGYYWDPCSTNGACLLVPGRDVSAEVHVCKDLSCVENILNKNGTQHLEGVYEVIIGKYISNAVVRKMEVKESYRVK